MASQKEAKKKAVGEKHGSRSASNNAYKVTKKRSNTSKKTKKLARENLIMKLPAELRNHIYELVLVENKIVQVGGRRIKKLIGHLNLWHEPKLLRVSKAIRTEASTVYYHSNKFEIYVHISSFDKACRWLSRNYNLGQSAVDMEFSLSVIGMQWRDLGETLPLAELAHEADLSLGTDGHISFWEHSLNTRKGHGLHQIITDVAKLGVRAKQSGISRESLQATFEEWLITVYSLKGKLNLYAWAKAWRDERKKARRASRT